VKTKNLLTVREVASRLGVCRQRINQLLRSGQLVGQLVAGRVWLVRPSDLERIDRRPGPGRPRKAVENA
jgi:excisionase family DNA binding protein